MKIFKNNNGDIIMEDEKENIYTQREYKPNNLK